MKFIFRAFRRFFVSRSLLRARTELAAARDCLRDLEDNYQVELTEDTINVRNKIAALEEEVDYLRRIEIELS